MVCKRAPFCIVLFVALCLCVLQAFGIRSPFAPALPDEPVLEIIVQKQELPKRDHARRMFAMQMDVNEAGSTESLAETGNISFVIPVSQRTTFYSFVDQLRSSVKKQTVQQWLRIKAKNEKAAETLRLLINREKKTQRKLSYLSRCLFKECTLPIERWRFAVKQVIKQLKEHALEISLDYEAQQDASAPFTTDDVEDIAIKRAFFAKQGWKKIQQSSLEHFPLYSADPDEKGTLLQQLEKKRAEEEIEAEVDDHRTPFWQPLLRERQLSGSFFYLDYQNPLMNPGPYNVFHTIELIGIDYEMVAPLLFLFSGVQRLCVFNKGFPPLEEPLQLTFSNFDHLHYLYLSYDSKLFVRDYQSIVKNYPGNNLEDTKRKVIVGPLYAKRVNGYTAVPAGSHPLLFDNFGIANYLADRTQRFFSTMPIANHFIKIEFFGQNSVTAIDFGRRPVSSSVLESLLQAQIDKTFDPSASWDERLAWSNKFSVLEYIDLSGTNVHDLVVARNLKRLHTLILNDTALGHTVDSRYLPRLQRIDFSFQPYGLVGANLGFIRMNLLNFLKIKHTFLPIAVFVFAVGVVTLHETIKDAVTNALSQDE
ncbi:MAG: hypothetical protein ACPGUZ_01510 [Holosporaceae bacterium]